VRGVFEIDTSRANIEHVVDCLCNVIGTRAIAALDIRGDRDRHRFHNLRDRANHRVAIDLFGIAMPFRVRNTGARRPDRGKAGLLEDPRARRVPRVRQQQPAGAVLVAKPRST